MAVAVALLVPLAGSARAAEPKPGTPEYTQRDNQNQSDAYGRETGPNGQFNNPNYQPALTAEGNDVGWSQLGQQLASPNRLSLTPGNVFPGWNVGNPLRRGWGGSRGQVTRVAWTNRYGALIRGDVFAPLPGAHDPYSGAELKPPYPGAVITTGSIQGSERMYWWLAEDLAERGYVVLTYDVQGQGTSETLPHQNDQVNALPFCNPFAKPGDKEESGCPGVPFQQESNFIYGTQDALGFFLSTPGHPYPNPAGADASVNRFNPMWGLFDSTPDRETATPGRTTRVAIIGHSLGAAAVSYVQGVDDRVETVVALDKLSGSGNMIQDQKVMPVVPALAVQSEYGFNTQPYYMSHGSSFSPQPGPPDQPPPPRRELQTGFDQWRKAGVDAMLVVPRASTHLEYSDISYALPASRYGQDLTSVYVQAWLDRYLKHVGEPASTKRRAVRKHKRRVHHRKRGHRRKKRHARGHKRRSRARTAGVVAAAHPNPLLGTSFRYLEPVAVGKWDPVTLERSKLLSFYFCSAYSMHDARTGRLIADGNVGSVAGCPVFGSEGARGGAGTCLARRSPIGPRNIGRVRIGYPRKRLLRRVPAPGRRGRRAWRWCVKKSRGTVRAVFSRKGRVELVATTARAHGNRGVRPGSSARRLRRAYPRRAALGRGLFRARRGSARLIGLRRGHVRFIAVASPRVLHDRKALRRALRRGGLGR